ncbi:hypothetical protein ACFY30_27670 [Streptomyces sp. NPDC000345]|uniref:hypothetical protein n=1 Tax=Streptomyces sp. NPDC000345 TaxID=3364537 RepID=UPI0036AA60B6
MSPGAAGPPGEVVAHERECPSHVCRLPGPARLRVAGTSGAVIMRLLRAELGLDLVHAKGPAARAER